MGVVLAVSSSGGHWSQLMLLRPAFEGMPVVFVSTVPGIGEAYGLSEYHHVPDCNRDSGFGIFRTAWECLKIFRRTNPSAVISTGALPGLLMVIYARLAGRRTIWVDSIANSERMSMCGNAARRLAHKCFVQWPDLTSLPGAKYAGSVL
jgi:UDP-N-acetylglucosamine:LPS N-acetylglucosamine transferase